MGRMQVRHAVLRDDRGMRGLLPKLRECLRARESTTGLQNMTREQARAHLLKQWDLEPMNLAAAGGGGGDPRLIDEHVRGVRIMRVEREKSFELQAISLRQQLDEQRRQLEEAQAAARRHEQGAICSLRKLEADRHRHSVELRAAADAAKEEQQRFAAQLKEQRAAAAAAKRALLAEMQAERVTADERFTTLQVEATALERQLFKAGAALRATSKEKEAELGRVEAELRKMSEGRIWARVHEAEAKRKQAEAKVADLERQVDELQNEKRQRSQQVRAACSECALGYHESSSR